MKTQISYKQQATTLAVSVGVGMTSTVADPSDASNLEWATTSKQAEVEVIGKDINSIEQTTVRIPVSWDEKAKERFDELMLLKVQRKTSTEEDVEFQELYDARENALDNSLAEELVKEFKSNQALKELLDAFDRYVITKKIAH